jgi:hypothetical protein
LKPHHIYQSHFHNAETGWLGDAVAELDQAVVGCVFDRQKILLYEFEILGGSIPIAGAFDSIFVGWEWVSRSGCPLVSGDYNAVASRPDAAVHAVDAADIMPRPEVYDFWIFPGSRQFSNTPAARSFLAPVPTPLP